VLGIRAYTGASIASKEIRQLEPRATQITEARNAQAQLDAAVAREQALLGALAESLGSRPLWRAPLTFLSQITQSGVELLEITGDFGPGDRDDPTLTLRGRAPVADDEGDPIMHLLAAVKAEPYVSDARIVSTNLESGATRRREFVMAVQLRGMPVKPPYARVASVEGVSP
jgi:hypothetical protein